MKGYQPLTTLRKYLFDCPFRQVGLFLLPFPDKPINIQSVIFRHNYQLSLLPKIVFCVGDIRISYFVELKFGQYFRSERLV